MNKTEDQRKAIDIMCGPATHDLFYGGSGSGKTVICSYALCARSLKVPSRHAILRRRFRQAKTSVGLGTMPEVLERIGLIRGDGYDLNKSDWFFSFPNGSEIWLGGLDDKERTDKILGTEYSTILFEECSEMQYDAITTALTRLRQPSELVKKAYFTENPPLKSHWSHKLFIEHIDPEDNTPVAPEDFVALQMNPEGNRLNLGPEYLERLKKLPARKRKRFYDGIFGDDVLGALWTMNMISAYRVAEAPALVRIVVGVDPAVTSQEKSEETGIIVGGICAAGHIYILDDVSMKGTPLEWGQAVVAAYKKWKADRIIGEVNQGGDLVETVLRGIERAIPYKSVHASRGKILRAEPISGLYEQGYVHHVGEFPELEDEMVSYTGDKTDDSPNRLDAMVHLATELSGAVVPHVYSGAEDRTPAEQRIDDEIELLLEGMTPQERALAAKIAHEVEKGE